MKAHWEEGQRGGALHYAYYGHCALVFLTLSKYRKLLRIHLIEKQLVRNVDVDSNVNLIKVM